MCESFALAVMRDPIDLLRRYRKSRMSMFPLFQHHRVLGRSAPSIRLALPGISRSMEFCSSPYGRPSLHRSFSRLATSKLAKSSRGQ